MPADNRRVDFADIRQRADFRAVLAHYGLKPVGKGDQVKILCPFHPDEEPSCSVNLATRVFHCFSCHHAGNVLDFVHRMETLDGTPVSLRHSALKIAELSGIELPGGTPVRKGARKPQDGPDPHRAQTGPSTTPNARPASPARPKKATGERLCSMSRRSLETSACQRTAVGQADAAHVAPARLEAHYQQHAFEANSRRAKKGGEAARRARPDVGRTKRPWGRSRVLTRAEAPPQGRPLPCPLGIRTRHLGGTGGFAR